MHSDDTENLSVDTFFHPNGASAHVDGPPAVDGAVAAAVLALPSLDPARDEWLTPRRTLAGDEGLIYAIDPLGSGSIAAVGQAHPGPGGKLHWYRHLGLDNGAFRWQGPKTVGTGWGRAPHVFSGGGGIIYAVDAYVEPSVPELGSSGRASGGDLYWYRHVGRADGSFRWEGPKLVNRGWGGYKQVFSGGDGIIYAIEPTRTEAESLTIEGRAHPRIGGRLLWWRHVGHADGSFRWEGPKTVGTGWGEFKHVFSGGDGIIYAVEPAVDPTNLVFDKPTAGSGGRLLWYRHVGREDGSFHWEGAKTVGTGWGKLEHVFAGDGVIYAIDPVVEATAPMFATGEPGARGANASGGHLYWYRHLGREHGTFRWQGPKQVGTGWGGLNHIFSGGDGSPVKPPAALHGERICDFMDPPGSPTVGIRSYGLKDGHRRGLQMTYSVTGSIPGANLAQIVQTASNVWMAATAPAPGRSPALSLTPAPSGPGDIAISVGAIAPQLSGQTSPDGGSITISSTFPFTAQNPVAGGTCSHLATVTHEMGQALGLLHSTSPVSVMNPGNCALETLDADDVAAARALYAWRAQQAIPNVGTDASPALCACGDSLVMAWKGIGETNLWVSRSYDGVNWTPQARVFGAASTDGPALAWDGSTLWMAFTGIDGDSNLYWTACTDTSASFAQGFSQVRPIPGTGSTNGPTMTIVNGAPLLVWKGVEDDQGMYYATYAGGAWSAQKLIGGAGSVDRPTICVDFDGMPRLVWRGVDGDDGLYTSALVGSFWQPQDLVRWIVVGNGPSGTVGIGYPGSALGPSIATADPGAPSFTAGGGVRGNVFLAWCGVPGDSSIYFTQGAPGGPGEPPVVWSSQAAIEGVATSHRPAIAFLGARIHLVWKGSGRDHTIWTTSL